MVIFAHFTKCKIETIIIVLRNTNTFYTPQTARSLPGKCNAR